MTTTSMMTMTTTMLMMTVALAMLVMMVMMMTRSLSMVMTMITMVVVMMTMMTAMSPSLTPNHCTERPSHREGQTNEQTCKQANKENLSIPVPSLPSITRITLPTKSTTLNIVIKSFVILVRLLM